MLANAIAESTTITITLVGALVAVAVSAASAFVALRFRVLGVEARLLALDAKTDATNKSVAVLDAWRHREAGRAEAVHRANTAPYDLPPDPR